MFKLKNSSILWTKFYIEELNLENFFKLKYGDKYLYTFAFIVHKWKYKNICPNTLFYMDTMKCLELYICSLSLQTKTLLQTIKNEKSKYKKTEGKGQLLYTNPRCIFTWRLFWGCAGILLLSLALLLFSATFLIKFSIFWDLAISGEDLFSSILSFAFLNWLKIGN